MDIVDKQLNQVKIQSQEYKTMYKLLDLKMRIENGRMDRLFLATPTLLLLGFINDRFQLMSLLTSFLFTVAGGFIIGWLCYRLSKNAIRNQTKECNDKMGVLLENEGRNEEELKALNSLIEKVETEAKNVDLEAGMVLVAVYWLSFGLSNPLIPLLVVASSYIVLYPSYKRQEKLSGKLSLS